MRGQAGGACNRYTKYCRCRLAARYQPYLECSLCNLLSGLLARANP